jgi:hypothetical protein
LHELDELMQVPEPLHREPVTVPLAQAVVAQGVLAEALRQLPAPLQLSPVAQLSATGVQSPLGSVSAFVGPQVPSAPEALSAALQDWHAPVHAVAQHTPSTQKSLSAGQITSLQQVVVCELMQALPQQAPFAMVQHTKGFVGSQCRSVGWQRACVISPTDSSSRSPVSPEAHANKRCAKAIAHQTANPKDRTRRFWSPLLERIDDMGRLLQIRIVRDPI